jgi:acetyl-CoA acetyltransferase
MARGEMASHPFHDVAIVGVHNTQQARVLEGYDSRTITLEAGFGAIEDAGLSVLDIDGVVGQTGSDFIYQSRIGPVWRSMSQLGIPSVLEAAAAIATGMASVVLVSAGSAGMYTERESTAPWTRPAHEFVVSYGMFTAAEFALIARRHMHLYGTTSEHLGAVAVTQRDYAVKRPGTLGFGKPLTLAEHQASPMITDPFRRYDCTRNTDGGIAVLVASAERARSLRSDPVYILGAGTGHNIANWHSGQVFENHDNIKPAKARAFAQAGLELADIDMAQLYDPFSISPLMQLEAFGFVKEGQGGPFYADGGAGPDGLIPTNTGGGQLSAYYTTGYTGVAEAILQLRGEAGAGQLKKAGTALVSGHGMNAGVQNTWAHACMILGSSP